MSASGRGGPRNLLVVSHVIHYRHQGRLFAYGPYAREIDVWADLFPRVLIASPCRDAEPEGDSIPFDRPNVEILPQRGGGGATPWAKLRLVAALPSLALGLVRAMRQADAIHVRCPGNLGLMGGLLAPFFCRFRVAKYAGQWDDYRGEAGTVRFQKMLLSSRWWGAPVTVYGRKPDQPAHVIPFFTSILTEAQAARARRAASSRRGVPPLRILYVGRVSKSKNVGVLIEAVAELTRRSIACRCVVVGDGPERSDLERRAAVLESRDRVEFVGAVSHEQVFDHYERADVLVLASQTEGWPKAIVEGMAFGLICIGSDRGLVPEILGEGRGLVVPPGDLGDLVEALGRIARAPEEFAELRSRAARWAGRFTLEGLREALGALLTERWGTAIPAPGAR